MKKKLKTGFLCIAGLLALVGCTTVKYIPVEKVRTEYVDKIKRDSIHVLDSVVIREKAGERVDTLEITRWRTEYRDKLLRDSVFVLDSIRIPYPVEKTLTRWQAMKMDMGGFAIGGMIVTLLALFIWFLVKIRKIS